MKLPDFKLYRTAVQNLEAAYKLVRYHWTTNQLAVDCDGKSCSVKSEKAEAFCALGAVKRINGPGEIKAIKLLREAAKLQIKKEGRLLSNYRGNAAIFHVNDHDGKSAVLRMFHSAIAMAKK